MEKPFINSNVTLERHPGFLWTPVRTKPRREKKLAEYCARNGIGFYLPLRRSVRRYNRRTFEFQVPMFSGYVFCSLDHTLQQKLVMCNAFAYKLGMNEKSEELLISELQSIMIMERASQEVEIEVRPELVAGTRIIVKNGPFRNMGGVVERRKGKTTIAINIEILGQSASTEIDVEDLEIDE